MHNPRGSNDRNCERNVNRNNGNLLFDSQNNAKGGYACPRAVANSNDQTPQDGLTPRMKFEEGSKLEVEWTAQHGCGQQKESESGTLGVKEEIMAANANVHCEIVVQLACSGTLDPMMQYSGNQAHTVTGNKVTFNAASTPNGLIAVPREGIPNSDADAATNRIGTTDPGAARLIAGQNEAQTLRSNVHETPEWYNECNRVKRNRNLFTADQNVNRRSAIGTRQNPNGGRRGLECPEERDYYPYWRPSPFLDVAYLVDDGARCGTGTTPCGGDTGTACVGDAGSDWVGTAQGFTIGASTTQYGSCILTKTGKIPKNSGDLTGNARTLYNRREWPNNEVDCAQIAQEGQIEWKNYLFNPDFEKASANADPFTEAAKNGPECDVLDYSRSNHLGNTGVDDQATRYTMTIPKVNPADAFVSLGGLSNVEKADVRNARTAEGEPCFLRIRYNMSSSDYLRNLSSANNGDASPIQQDPLVNVNVGGSTKPVQLALNTNQVARTFQDRSYVFYIVPRPRERSEQQQVINLNVRGKRGNIVQTYPAVEYDFIPNEVMIKDPENTVLALQWVGSDYNPARGCNDGEGGPAVGNNNVKEALIANRNVQGSNGNSRTDRMTLLEQNAGSKKNYPFTGTDGNADLMGNGFAVDAGQAQRFMDAKAEQQLQALNLNLNCLTSQEINNINNENRRENHPRNCAEGNALSPYFSTEFVTFTGQRSQDKQYVLYSARNNNFSNRDTKLKVYVQQSNTSPTLPQELILNYDQIKNDLFNKGLNYDAATGSYDTEEMIEANSDTDVIGFDPVENDDYGEGAKEGCTQDMLVFDGASSVFSHFNLAIFFFSMVFALF